jgi:glycosyltransferase domain-containing protein
MYTVLIQTRNRPDRLKRLLTYLADNKETSKIIIADGSDPEALSINQQTLSELKIRTLQHLIPVTQEQSQIFAQIRTALSHMDTPFIAMMADDDFVLPDALREGSRFLAANPDFLSVTGKGVSCTLDGTGKTIGTSVYQQTDCRGNSAIERLRAYGSIGTSVFYQLRRTSHLHALFDVIGNFTIPYDTPIFEVIDKLMSVVSGKVAKLDWLFIVREMKSTFSTTYEVFLKGRLTPAVRQHLISGDIEHLHSIKGYIDLCKNRTY